MFKHIFLTLLLATPLTCKSQSEDIALDSIKIAPKFSGGTDSLYKFISKNLKWSKSHWQGMVIIEFMVEEDGSISDLIITKGNDEMTNKNIIELFTKMPKWIPGSLHGKATRMKAKYPIRIRFD